MRPVAVRLLHLEAGRDAGPLERQLAAARQAIALRVAATFRAAGADDAVVVSGPPDDTPYGRRLRELAGTIGRAGLVVAGSGALALATPADLAAFIAVARAADRVALANNRYSADAVAIACPDALAELPDELPGDNALPRWLAEVGGYRVRDVRGRRRLQVDVDGPLDALLAGEPWPDAGETDLLRHRVVAVRAVAADARGELVVVGRTSAGTLRWLEVRARARVRGIVEERGLRAAASAARADGRTNRRPPRSVLGALLDRDGPEALGRLLADLGDGAVVDSRVLLAHRLGADERRWPALEDRLASDLLLADLVRDPWLRALTASAADAAIPVLLGGHTLVGPGLPPLLGDGT